MRLRDLSVTLDHGTDLMAMLTAKSVFPVGPLTDRIRSCWRVFYRGCARPSRGFRRWQGIGRRGHDRTTVWRVLYRSQPRLRQWLLSGPGLLSLLLRDEALSIGHDR